MRSRPDRGAATLRDALEQVLAHDDPRRERLAASTVRALLDLRAGRRVDLPASVRAVAERVDDTDLGEAYQRLLGPTRTGAGVYYTPSWLVEHLLDVALEPVLDRAAGAGMDAVLALRVCDPSCGSGRFLVAAARRVADRLTTLGHPDAVSAAAGCVHGIDLDPVAVELTAAALGVSGGAAQLVVGDAMGAAADHLVGRCDVVVGNPPFRSRMRGGEAVVVPAAVDGVALGPYTDLSAAFLLRGAALLAPGGVLAMVQPRSVLSARDAGPVRRALTERGEVTALWVSSTPVFPGTPVLTCAPVLHRASATQGPVTVVEDRAPAREVPATPERLAGGWGFLLAEHAEAAPSLADRTPLGERATCTADFRDQYYGLVGHVDEGTPGPGVLALLTSGTIDPARCRWGERPARFARSDWLRPVVAVGGLEGAMTRWVTRRAVPKLLVATQGRVVEAVADEHGAWLPSVPVLSVLAPPERLWHLLAALLSPVVTAHVAGEYAGSALAVGAIKLSAAQLAAVPLPEEGEAWDAAADAVRRAQGAASTTERARLLLLAAAASTRAYGAEQDLVGWWAARAERSVPGITDALSRRG